MMSLCYVIMTTLHYDIMMSCYDITTLLYHYVMTSLLYDAITLHHTVVMPSPFNLILLGMMSLLYDVMLHYDIITL